MNIVYCVNDNPVYINMLNESIKSIKKYNTNVSFYIIVNNDKPISSIIEGKQYCYKLDKIYRERLNSHEGKFDRLNNSSYLKLFIPEILADIDKCLFVDCDCLCFSNIEDMYNSNVNYIKLWSYDQISLIRKTELNIPKNGYYYLSSLALMNLKALRNDNFRENILNNINSIKCSFWCHEETLLNYNYYDKIQRFSPNVQIFPLKPITQEFINSIKQNDIKFVHVCGKDKSKFYSLLKYV